MKNYSIKENDNEAKAVVIPDECGDTMWDAVLQQEVRACDVKVNSKIAASLQSGIDAVKVCDATAAK